MKKSVDVVRSYFSPSPNPLTTQMYEQLMIIKNEAGDHIDEWFDENLKSDEYDLKIDSEATFVVDNFNESLSRNLAEPEGLERAKPTHTQCQSSQRVELQCLGHATRENVLLAKHHHAHR